MRAEVGSGSSVVLPRSWSPYFKVATPNPHRLARGQRIPLDAEFAITPETGAWAPHRVKPTDAPRTLVEQVVRWSFEGLERARQHPQGEELPGWR